MTTKGAEWTELAEALPQEGQRVRIGHVNGGAARAIYRRGLFIDPETKRALPRPTHWKLEAEETNTAEQ